MTEKIKQSKELKHETETEYFTSVMPSEGNDLSLHDVMFNRGEYK